MTPEQKQNEVLKLFGVPQQVIDEAMEITMPESKNFVDEGDEYFFSGEQGF